MKYLFLFVCLAFAQANHAAKASTNYSPNFLFQAPTIEQKVAKMTEMLQLSKAQQAKYLTLLKNTEVKKTELKEKVKTATPEVKAKLQADFKSNYESELKKILTTEQYAKMEKMAKEKGKK